MYLEVFGAKIKVISVTEHHISKDDIKTVKSVYSKVKARKNWLSYDILKIYTAFSSFFNIFLAQIHLVQY